MESKSGLGSKRVYTAALCSQNTATAEVNDFITHEYAFHLNGFIYVDAPTRAVRCLFT